MGNTPPGVYVPPWKTDELDYIAEVMKRDYPALTIHLWQWRRVCLTDHDGYEALGPDGSTIFIPRPC